MSETFCARSWGLEFRVRGKRRPAGGPSPRPKPHAPNPAPRRVAAALAALVLFAAAVAPPARAGENEFRYDWGVAYWMPYDNDLERGKEPILKAIAKGVTNARTAVAVQADLGDLLGMHRITVTPEGAKETLVASDDSADPDQLVAYLEWFIGQFRCRRYAVVIMNHGGGLDEMCLDDLPETPGKNWMSGAALGRKLRELKPKMPGKWELLFLQQCGRASLENLYSFRGTAGLVMASPLRIGAPNTYYTELHQFLEKTPEAAGGRVAEVIAAKDQHYFVYACARGDRLAELPGKLDAMLKPWIEKQNLTAPERPAAIYQGKVGKGPLADAAAYLRSLAAANAAGAPEVEEFLKWVKTDLLAETWRSRHADAGMSKLCGLSLYVPADAGGAAACNDLDIYKDSKLAELWRKLGAGEGRGRTPPEWQSLIDAAFGYPH